ncbi:cation diffusion facilitator family transporter [Rhizobium sp. Leaf371]|uniref:cation diffusion facilitator family transporter n=1 Tax=Rhizobium sp. Leaf371 TaxID=1736355 RepID=UPI000AB2CEF4|nr:cation diffusion facilitator family transporter [Rhizobium sp. Leaf371]
MKGAYLEVWADMLGSVGVIAGAVAIYLTGWSWLDPIVAVLIAVWVLPRTWILLRDTSNVLLEGVPKGMSLDDVRAAVLGLAGVVEVHDVHLWSMSGEDASFSAHVVLTAGEDPLAVRRDIERMLLDRFETSHTTLQIDSVGGSRDDHIYHA